MSCTPRGAEPVRLPRDRLTLVSAGIRLDGGGAAHLARLLARAGAEFAAERDLAFEVLALRGAGVALDGIRVRTFAGRKTLLAASVARRQLTRRTVLVFDHLGPARAQNLLPPRLRSPYALFLLGTEAWGALRSDRRRALLGATLRVAISEHTRRRVLAATPQAAPIEVLHPTLEPRPATGEVDHPLLERCGADFALTVGRLAPGDRYKGHDPLLEALAMLRRRGGGARLVVVGEGDDRRRLEARAAALGLADDVVFTGFVSEATRDALYEKAALFAMPSGGEGFGLVYLEAMRAGKPCLALRDSAAEEIVDDGETGALVAAGDVAALADALARLLGDRALAQRLGAAGRARFESEFGWRRFRDRFLDVLDRLLRESEPER